MDLSAIRLDGADQYRRGAGKRRWRGDSDQGFAKGPFDGAGRQRAMVLSRSEARRNACSGGVGEKRGVRGSGSGGRDELPELWKSGKAANYVAVLAGDRWNHEGLRG